MTELFNVSFEQIKGALVSGVLMGLLAVSVYVIQLGDIFSINSRNLLNVFVLAVLTAVVSVVKSFLTTKEGNFAGVVKIK